MMAARSFYSCRYDTPSFSFEAYGQTPAEVRTLLAVAFKRHIRQTGADPEYFNVDEAEVVCRKIGRVYRDGSQYGR